MPIINNDIDLILVDLLFQFKQNKTINVLQQVNYRFYTYIKMKKKERVIQLIKKCISTKKIRNYSKNYENAFYKLVSIKYPQELKIDDNTLKNIDFPYTIDQETNLSNEYFSGKKYLVTRRGDFISNFIIIGKNITKVELIIGITVVAQSFYLNAGLISFVPMKHGLPIYKLPVHEVWLKIYADDVKTILTTVYVLDCKILSNRYEELVTNHRNYINIKEYVNYYKNLVYESGMAFFKFI